MIGKSLVRVSVDSPLGSDPGQVVHTLARWGMMIEQLSHVTLSRNSSEPTVNSWCSGMVWVGLRTCKPRNKLRIME